MSLNIVLMKHEFIARLFFSFNVCCSKCVVSCNMCRAVLKKAVLRCTSREQVEMCGSSVFDYLHAEDHVEFAEMAGLALSHGRPLASPGEENAGPVGTHNPDGT